VSSTDNNDLVVASREFLHGFDSFVVYG